MNLLLICGMYDYAGGKILLSQGINKHTEHNSRCLVGKEWYMDYEKDILLKENNENIEKLAEEADIFVFFLKDYSYPFGSINWMDYIDGKKVLYNPQGGQIVNTEMIREVEKGTLTDKYMGTNTKIFIFHVDQPRFPIEEWMPVYLPIWDSDFLPGEKNFSGSLIIGQSPSAPERKDAVEFELIVKELQKEGYDIILDIVTGVKNKECLSRKRKWHIAFDNFQDNHNGKSGWESLSMGIPTFASLNYVEENYLEDWGNGFQPFLKVENAEELKLGILKFYNDRAFLVHKSLIARRWMEEYNSPKRILDRFFQIVKQADIFA